MAGCALFIWGRPTCPSREALLPPLWRCQWGSKERPFPFRQCFLEVLKPIVQRADGRVSERISRHTHQCDSHTPGQQLAVVNQTRVKEHVIKKKQQLEWPAPCFRQMMIWGCNAQLQKSKELQRESCQTLKEQRFCIFVQHGCVNGANESCRGAPPYTSNDGYKLQHYLIQ